MLASSKETPCLSSLLFAFLESHSNISIMYILNSIDPQAPPQFLPAIRNRVEVHTNCIWTMEGERGEAGEESFMKHETNGGMRASPLARTGPFIRLSSIQVDLQPESLQPIIPT